MVWFLQKRNTIISQENQIYVLTQQLISGFTTSDKVFVKAFDRALASFNVHHQAYYGGTFVGNHVHNALEVHMYQHLISRENSCKNAPIVTSLPDFLFCHH